MLSTGSVPLLTITVLAISVSNLAPSKLPERAFAAVRAAPSGVVGKAAGIDFAAICKTSAAEFPTKSVAAIPPAASALSPGIGFLESKKSCFEIGGSSR